MAEWFAPKRYGFGCGFPIAWQGWLASALFVAVMLGSTLIFADRPLIILSIVLPATALFLLVAAKTTRGGWRWRWGERG
jgi:hypothetical protein